MRERTWRTGNLGKRRPQVRGTPWWTEASGRISSTTALNVASCFQGSNAWCSKHHFKYTSLINEAPPLHTELKFHFSLLPIPNPERLSHTSLARSLAHPMHLRDSLHLLLPLFQSQHPHQSIYPEREKERTDEGQKDDGRESAKFQEGLRR